MKICNIGDLELLDREIGSTVGYPEETISSLKQIRNLLREEKPDIVILGGDLTRDLLKDEKYRATVYNILRDINEECRKRFPHDVTLYYRGDDGSIVERPATFEGLLSLEGNHDKPGKLGSTFYHFLKDTQVIASPLSIKTADNTIINLIHHNSDVSKAVSHAIEGDFTIDIFHLELDTKGALRIEPTLEVTPEGMNFFQAHINVVNHIHKAHAPKIFTRSDNTQFVLAVQGSTHRTKYSPENQRDYSNVTFVDTETGQVYYRTIELSPWDKFYNLGKTIKLANTAKALVRYSEDLDVKVHELVPPDPMKKLQSMGLRPEVQAKVMSYLGH